MVQNFDNSSSSKNKQSAGENKENGVKNFKTPNTEPPIISQNDILDINTRISMFSEVINDSKSSEFEVATSIKQLGELGDTKAVPILLQTLSNTKSNIIAVTAIEALGKMRDKSTIAHIIEKIHDNDPQIRAAVVKAISYSKDTACLPQITNFLDDKNDIVRLAAAASLGRMGDEKSIAFLCELIGDPNAEIRAEVAKSIILIINTALDQKSIKGLEETRSFFESAKKKEKIPFVRDVLENCQNSLYVTIYAKKSEEQFEKMAEEPPGQSQTVALGSDKVGEKNEKEKGVQKLVEDLNKQLENSEKRIKIEKRRRVFPNIMTAFLSLAVMAEGYFIYQGIQIKEKQEKQIKESQVKLSKKISDVGKTSSELEKIQNELSDTKTKMAGLEQENFALKGIDNAEKEMKEVEKDIDAISGLFGKTAIEHLGKCDNEFWKSTVEKYGLDIAYQRRAKFLEAAKAAAIGNTKNSKQLYKEAMSIK